MAFTKRTAVRLALCICVLFTFIGLSRRFTTLSTSEVSSDIVMEYITSRGLDRTMNTSKDASNSQKEINTFHESQEKRKLTLYQYCERTNPIIGRVDYGEGFLYNDKHRMIYCRVPKVACSTWKRVLLLFEGAQKTLFEINKNDVHGYNYKYLRDLTVAQMLQRKNFYYSFMFSRHPFDRLFSAYRNKFLDPKGRYWYLEALGPWMVYNHIKSNKEMDAYLAKYHNGSRRLNVPFTQFVKYVLAEPPGRHDTHWQPQTDICKLCNFKFDHIGKFETMRADAKVIFEGLKQPELLKQFNNVDDLVYTHKTTSLLKKYYQELPKELIADIYKFYKDDFEAFNYDPNHYFNTW